MRYTAQVEHAMNIDLSQDFVMHSKLPPIGNAARGAPLHTARTLWACAHTILLMRGQKAEV
jgi:hypothetical protein